MCRRRSADWDREVLRVAYGAMIEEGRRIGHEDSKEMGGVEATVSHVRLSKGLVKNDWVRMTA